MSAQPVWERDGADWPNRDASRFVEAGGLRWHVQVAGEGPVVLLLHGTGAATHSWRGLLPLLATRYRIVAPDLPGHGFTDLPGSRRMSLPGMAGALGDLLLALGERPVAAIGHSAGAAIAIRMTFDSIIAPQALVGINAALMPFRGMAAQIFPPLARMLVLNPLVPAVVAYSAGDRRRVKRLMEGTGSRLDAAGLDFYARLLGTRRHADAALRMMANWDLEALFRDLPGLAVPLLLVVGAHDRTVAPQDAGKIAALLPAASVRSLPGGHLVHEEAADATAALILPFLDERLRQSV